MDIVVIGAGLSGLTAAAVLHEAGVRVQMIEAGPQVGGRIRALRDPASDKAMADLGPTWVWPKYQPVVARWVNSLGLLTYEQFNEGDAILHGYGSTPFRQPLPGQDGMVRIAGGPTAFIEGLTKRLEGVITHISTPATGIIENGREHVDVHLGSGKIITANKVVVSVPLRIAVTTLQMPWAPTSLLDVLRRTPTWMSTHAKAVATYDRPFWREAGLSGRIASRTGPLIEAHDHSGSDGTPAAIFGFVGWPPDARQKDPEGLNQAILNQLSKCLGPAAAHPNNLVVHDWATNPHIVTDSDIAGPENHPEVGPAILRQPFLDGRVRFAVSEASEISPGLIEGALAAGEKAARGILSPG